MGRVRVARAFPTQASRPRFPRFTPCNQWFRAKKTPVLQSNRIFYYTKKKQLLIQGGKWKWQLQWSNVFFQIQTCLCLGKLNLESPAHLMWLYSSSSCCHSLFCFQCPGFSCRSTEESQSKDDEQTPNIALQWLIHHCLMMSTAPKITILRLQTKLLKTLAMVKMLVERLLRDI